MWYLLLLGFLGMVWSQTTVSPIDCSDKDNGFIFWGCKAFHRCQGGRPEYVECGPEFVFDETTGDCNRIESVRSPCGMDLRNLCVGVNGTFARRIPIREYQEEFTVGNTRRSLRCAYFAVCYKGVHYGTQKCTGGNVFSESEQFCVDPTRLAGECGLRDTRPQRRG